MKPLVITPGDPDGIGPEVTAKALVARRDAGNPVHAVLIGDPEAMHKAAEEQGLALERVGEVDAAVPEGSVALLVPPGPEPIEVRAIIASVKAIQSGVASALVTGPVTKSAITEKGFDFKGHTELLGELCGGVFPVMGFAGGRFKLVLVTTHLALRHVPDAITASRVMRVLRATVKAMRTQLGIAQPRLIVCGLNPHAGEGGLLGTEENDDITPAVVRARLEGIDAIGPVSAEVAFRMVETEADVVVAMYHDQGLAPLKLVDWGKSVNWTIGLPIIRTSVDHGTARDIAWENKADSSSMEAAIRWAEKLVAAQAD